MKYRLTYFITFILSVVAAVAFKDNGSVVQFFQRLSLPLIQIGVVTSCLFVLLTTTGGVAALRRKGTFGVSLFKTILWGVIAMLVSVLLGVILSLTLPRVLDVNFLNMPSDVIDAGIMSASALFSGSGLLSSPFTIILSIVAVSYLFGYFMKPDVDVIKPAYIVSNSFAEVGFRLGRFVSYVYTIALFFIGSFWFMSVGFQNLGREVWNLIIILAIGTMILVFIIFPLMYLIGIRFARKTAFGVIFSSIAISFSSFFSRNVLFSIPSAEVMLRHENAIPKKNASSMMPLLSIFLRAGVAFVSFIIAFLIVKFSDIEIGLGSYIALPFVCVALSVISGFYQGGLEILFVVSTALQTIGVNNTDYAMILFAILPFVSSISSFVDTSAAFFGVSALGVQERDLFQVIR